MRRAGGRGLAPGCTAFFNCHAVSPYAVAYIDDIFLFDQASRRLHHPLIALVCGTSCQNSNRKCDALLDSVVLHPLVCRVGGGYILTHERVNCNGVLTAIAKDDYRAYCVSKKRREIEDCLGNRPNVPGYRFWVLQHGLVRTYPRQSWDVTSVAAIAPSNANQTK
jgi:hypothetical protein